MIASGEIMPGSYVDKQSIVQMLETNGSEMNELFKCAGDIKEKTVGNSIYFRGLIEFSNICRKNCLYCGLRADNRTISRYNLSDSQILDSAMFAFDNNFASIVLQSGEIASRRFTSRIERLLKKISSRTYGRLRVTLSCGEQTKETYQRWFESGAQRYLLRIESSSPSLYARIHPGNIMHRHSDRLECLYALSKIGYQTGTGVMIGLPFQTPGDLADDLLFMKNFDIDMVGMGPYLEHAQTPLYKFRDGILPQNERFLLTLKMIALLRIMMPDINIAATTAMQAIDAFGREKAIRAGANVVMPNMTPGIVRKHYKPYDTKPCISEVSTECLECTAKKFNIVNGSIAYGQWGDSRHYINRTREPLTRF